MVRTASRAARSWFDNAIPEGLGITVKVIAGQASSMSRKRSSSPRAPSSPVAGAAAKFEALLP